MISIHAPRGGSDADISDMPTNIIISIHAPRGGSDAEKPCPVDPEEVFQSTLPAGGATPPPKN